MVGICLSKVVSIVDFEEYVGRYGFKSFANIASGYEHFVCCENCIGDEFCFLVYIVCGGMVSECVVYPVSVFFPLCFFVIDECFSFVMLIVFVCYEDGGENGKMIR